MAETPVNTALLSPVAIRGITLRSRIAVSPMCQYCAENGMADDWHLVHLGSRAAGGAGLVITEATAVTAQGRITSGDLGLWSDEQIEPLARIARFISRMGAVPGIQLAHAGRKASTTPPWAGGKGLEGSAAWETVSASAIPFAEGYHVPRALTTAEIDGVVEGFAAAARRALRAEFKVLELHAAHGYLLHQFLSPLTNHRTDAYGGTLENRMRLTLQVTRRIRGEMPAYLPLFVRISATDWKKEGWDLEQSVTLSAALKEAGVDLIDVSSGGLVPGVSIPLAPGYQVPFASTIRSRVNILTGAVGLITEPAQAEEIVASGKADVVLLAREMLREPYWALKAQNALGEQPSWPQQYHRASERKK
jgi:2,4-dienoyl-CoA reductase-like NADH-dependent reductase (Old Yellow Enzyme family)